MGHAVKCQDWHCGHTELNKFYGASDDRYVKLKGYIEDIKKPSALATADSVICKTSYSLDKLQITRLSGDPLPMDNCYINLGLIQLEKESATGQDLSQLALHARQGGELRDGKDQVALPTLFDERDAGHGKRIKPRRILIRGRAGVGKSTLCKKIVYEFTFRKIWNDMFDRILWIPLRRLDLGDHTWELKHVLKYQFFPQHSTGDYLAQEMCKVLERDQFGKTLFILDGLDEVFQFLDKESPKHSLLNSLLSKPNIIITSRPHIALPKDLVAINMELEVIGFSPEQVTEYISRWGCKSPSEIHGFLEQNQLVLDLVRIPIQLDALCYTWDMYPWNRGIPPRTMTELYSAMETKLWFNDLRRRNRNPQTTFNDKLMPDFQVMELARDDRRFLQRLAFTGFSLETLDFDLDFYDRVVRHYGLEYRTDEPWATRFAGLSFLRSSDPSNELNNGKKAYHFIHLTFQEYFAALYFVEQWITGKPLTCLTRDLRNKVRKENIDTSQFLHKHKYSSYHNVFWRFVCGLLNRKLEDSVWPNNKTPFISELYSQTSFFSELNNYQDLVGHSHHRLIMHCLMEVEDTNEAEGNVEAKDVINLRHTLEDRLSEWLKLQSHAGGSYKLTSSVEFPVRCIVSVLQRSSPVTKVALLASLEHQSHLSNAILEAIDERTQDDSLELRHHASAAMKSRQLPEHIKQATVERLWHEKRDIRLAALDILTAQNSLPKGSTEEILRLFDDEDEDIRLKAIEVFKTTRDPGAVNVALPKLREDCNQKVRLATLHLFEVHENSLSIPWENILTPHRGDDKEVYLASITLLKDRPELPDRVLQRLLGGLAHPSDEFDDEGARLEQIKFLKEHTGNPELLKLYTDFTRSRPSPTTSSGDEEVRLATMKFLKDRPNLPDTILIQLAKGLAHRNDKARSISVDLLQAQQSLSITVRNAITQGLGQGRVFQIAASAVLRSQRDLADHILHSFRKLLDDEDAQVRWNAFCVLAGQKDLSEDHLRAITGTLKTVETITDLNIVRHCMQLWKKPSSYLADDTMSSFKPLLCDQHGYVRLNVLAILEVQEAFPPDVMKYLTSRLQDPQTVINERDVSVFQNLEHLPEPSSKAIAALLHHGRVDVRSAASNVLKERDFLPTSVLGKITVDLKDGNTEVRLAAIKAIGGLAEPLSCHMYDVIESLLQNDTQKVRFVICQTLRHHSRLSDSILRAVVELCQTNDENVCKEARSVLCDMGLPGLKVYPQSTLQGSASCVQRPCDEDQPTTVQGSGSQDIHHTATIEAVRQLLRHNEDAQIAVIYRFRNHYQPLSMMELEVMTMGIQDVRERIQLEAITSICLYGPTPLPRHTVQAIWPLIRSSNDEIRCKALEALYDEHISSLEDLNAIAELLNDQSNEVRSEASSILGHQENPPPDVSEFVKSLLGDTSTSIEAQSAALQVLDDWEVDSLPEKTLTAIPKFLNGNEPWVAIAVLERAEDLPQAVLNDALHQVDLEDEDIMERVLWLFLDQSDDETLSSALMCQELATKIFEIHLRNYRNTAANAVHFMGKNHICFPSEFGSRTVNLEDPDVFKEAVRQARNAHLREVGAENLQVERFWVE